MSLDQSKSCHAPVSRSLCCYHSHTNYGHCSVCYIARLRGWWLQGCCSVLTHSINIWAVLKMVGFWTEHHQRLTCFCLSYSIHWNSRYGFSPMVFSFPDWPSWEWTQQMVSYLWSSWLYTKTIQFFSKDMCLNFHKSSSRKPSYTRLRTRCRIGRLERQLQNWMSMFKCVILIVL